MTVVYIIEAFLGKRLSEEDMKNCMACAKEDNQHAFIDQLTHLSTIAATVSTTVNTFLDNIEERPWGRTKTAACIRTLHASHTWEMNPDTKKHHLMSKNKSLIKCGPKARKTFEAYYLLLNPTHPIVAHLQYNASTDTTVQALNERLNVYLNDKKGFDLHVETFMKALKCMVDTVNKSL